MNPAKNSHCEACFLKFGHGVRCFPKKVAEFPDSILSFVFWSQVRLALASPAICRAHSSLFEVGTRSIMILVKALMIFHAGESVSQAPMMAFFSRDNCRWPFGDWPIPQTADHQPYMGVLPIRSFLFPLQVEADPARSMILCLTTFMCSLRKDYHLFPRPQFVETIASLGVSGETSIPIVNPSFSRIMQPSGGILLRGLAPFLPEPRAPD